MEGRVPLHSSSRNDDNISGNAAHNTNYVENYHQHIASPQHLRLPPALTGETYVIQIPKDQVYWVPPPQNARIAELHQNSGKNGKYRKKNPCRTWCVGVCITLLVLAVLIGIFFGILYFAFPPKAPDMSIKHLVVKKSKLSGKNLDFQVFLKIKNRDEQFRLSYEEDGRDLWLLSKDKKIGTGKFPKLYQEKQKSTMVKVNLKGSKGKLPLEVQKGLKDKKGNVTVSLTLDMNVPVRIKFWVMNLWKMKADVDCKFKVRNLGKSTRILSGKCNTKFNSYQ